MSTDWLSQPLSIKSIASKYTLPVVIRSALGFRGSSRPIILHSTTSVTFAYGRALKTHQSRNSVYQSFRLIDSEVVAIPLKYPGYFECLQPTSRGPDDGILPETSIHPIVEQMQIDSRSQAFYIASPLSVYTLERKSNEEHNRVWQQIEANQIILIEQLTYLEYTPTEKDGLTVDDYSYSWLFCFYKRILNRHEFVMKCILSNEIICYIPCSSTDEVCLYPVGQRGSTNVYKLQTIENLVEQFSLPINIKLAQFAGFETYKNFNGCLQLLGLQTQEFAVCASLSSTNVSFIPIKTPLKFVVVPVPLTSDAIINQLLRCQILIQSFDKQIRRIIISSHDLTPRRSRSKLRSTIAVKRSLPNSDQLHSKHVDQMTPTDSPSGLSAEKKRDGSKRRRAISTSVDGISPRQPFRRTLSNDSHTTYNSLIHPVRSQSLLKQSNTSTPTPPLSLSKKRSSQFSRISSPFTYDIGSHLVKDIDLLDANGAILLDDNTLFSSI